MPSIALFNPCSPYRHTNYQNPKQIILQHDFLISKIDAVRWLSEGRVHRVLIANRGEIALRAVRACRKLGLESVAVYSEADGNSPHVWAADRSVCIGPPPSSQSYLDAKAIIETARGTGCDAVYPGYGFLAEKASFAAACTEAGLIFIGPSAEVIALMGDKVAARESAERNGVPIVPGSPEGFTDAGPAAELADRIGFPLLLKAVGGGGGRGMRVVRSAQEFPSLFAQAAAEAEAAFGQADLFLERFFTNVRHIEVQVFGDSRGRIVHLWERDCSIQRRHQKLIEEAPSPVLDAKTRAEIADAAVSLARTLRYQGAGTIEFIYDLDSGRWFFIEMNTRIQVEHPVTEALFGVDLVVEQLRVAAGEALSFAQPKSSRARHAIEFRINAEDPATGFSPSPGRVSEWRPPSGKDIRLDSHVYRNYVVPPFYDSLLGKLIISGDSRAAMLNRAKSVLANFRVAGVATTLPFHAQVIERPEFVAGSAHTRWVEEEMLS